MEKRDLDQSGRIQDKIPAQASFNFTVPCALNTLISQYTIEFLWAFDAHE